MTKPDLEKCSGKFTSGERVENHRWLWMARLTAMMCQFCTANKDRFDNTWFDGEERPAEKHQPVTIESENQPSQSTML